MKVEENCSLNKSWVPFPRSWVNGFQYIAHDCRTVLWVVGHSQDMHLRRAGVRKGFFGGSYQCLDFSGEEVTFSPDLKFCEN